MTTQKRSLLRRQEWQGIVSEDQLANKEQHRVLDNQFPVLIWASVQNEDQLFQSRDWP